MDRKEIAIIGLGKMGSGLALNLIDQGWRVVGYNRTESVTKELEAQGVEGAYSFPEIKEKLSGPRVVWVMVPSGDPVEQTILGEEGLVNLLDEGDIIIDGGNSSFKETKRRYKAVRARGIRFMDAGVSGGPKGAREGACIMIGGRAEDFSNTEQIFKDLSVENGYAFFPGDAAGHFVKMVHNGIEYGMMQAIGEGFGVMKASEYDLNLTDVSRVYNHGSVIESRLIGWLGSAFQKYSENLEGISGSVHHSGEGQWTVEAAKEMNIETKVIEESLKFRIDSQEKPSFIGKVVSALRNQFGGHDVRE